MTIHLCLATEFLLQAVGDVCSGDGSESLARVSGFEFEGQAELVDAACEIFGLVMLACLARLIRLSAAGVTSSALP